mmetsp:Transcript_54154/g.86103  ORF Transcript_54154/g.86103 Transcript_54154/m.86103 type:complete len:122 (+) Transcript_54154:59-424(+)
MGATYSACCASRDSGHSMEPTWSQQPMPPHVNAFPVRLNAGMSSRSRIQDACIVCKKAAANTMCLPCGHLLICFQCSLRYVRADASGLHSNVRCPCCKKEVESFQRVVSAPPRQGPDVYGW